MGSGLIRNIFDRLLERVGGGGGGGGGAAKVLTAPCGDHGAAGAGRSGSGTVTVTQQVTPAARVTVAGPRGTAASGFLVP